MAASTFSRSAGSVTGARGGREVGRRGFLEVEGERRVRDQVGVPGTGSARRTGDVVLAVRSVEPDLDAAWLPGLPSGGGDVDDPVARERLRCLVVHG